MSYPQGPPGNPGYPSAQQPTTQFSAPTQQFGRAPEPGPAGPAGPSQLPMYLTIAVSVLGLGVYLSSFGPLFTAGADFFTPTLLDLGVVAAIAAALIAGVSLLPKQKLAPAVIAVLSVLAFLLVIAIVLTAPEGVSIDWGLYLIIAFTLFQAIVAVAVLLFDAGVITPPAPQPPRYEPQYGQYGGPGGQYYGTGSARRPRPAAGTVAASRLSAAVRRVPGRRPVDRRICRRSPERAPDPSDRIPDLRPAAAVHGADHPGTDADAIGDVFHAVGPPTVVV